ncbi:hypothetical protein KGQ19_08840 [Catenulispora sp. NL8]|uniref:Uncharacterized protein n=1 Tax=Catenulispora pinistramenti TaxID=2705254 RepID=A0ABS5KLR4_9ACTN|nr:hypothetical protein [Catenulispora pinistramenti]MBS2546974.1 hypothetical protein [Catenulispora pinistramenti]
MTMTVPEAGYGLPARPGRSRRRNAAISAGLGVAFVAVIAGGFGAVALWNAHWHKGPAIDRCEADVRDTIKLKLQAFGLSASAIADIAEQARITGLSAQKTVLTQDTAGAVYDDPGSSVLTVWEVHGNVAIANLPASATDLGPKDQLDCTAVVFKDGKIVPEATSVDPPYQP